MEGSIYNQKKDGEDYYLTPKTGNPKGTFIFMHGLGDSASSFLEIFNSNYLNPCSPSMKIILLQSPNTKVTINNYMIMPSWFDLFSLDGGENSYNFEDVKKNSKRIEKILQEEINYYKDPKKVFIGGFSQGCCMALYSGFERNEEIGGIVGFSGFLMPQINLKQMNTPHIIFHGEDDETLNFNKCKLSYNNIKNLNFNPIKNLGHSISMESLNLAKLFFKKFIK